MLMFDAGTVKVDSQEVISFRDPEGNVFVPPKPLCETIGVSWPAQYEKIKSDQRYSVSIIPLKTNQGVQEMVCLPLDQFPGWLYSINPNRVKPEIRDRVILFQKETFTAINDYWVRGSATRPGGVPMEELAKHGTREKLQ